MSKVDRKNFVPKKFQNEAYHNKAIPLKNEKALPRLYSMLKEADTISQPLIIANILDILGLMPGFRFLNIGLGSGYLAAIAFHLISLGEYLVGIEIDNEFAILAGKNLKKPFLRLN